MKMLLAVTTLFISAVFLSTPVNAVDFFDCQNELSRLRRDASNAESAASSAESAKQDYESCSQNRSAYSYDDCGYKKSTYSSAINSLISELDSINTRIRRIQNSCEYDMARVNSSSRHIAPQKVSRCEPYIAYRNKLPYDSLMKVCKQNMPEAECNKCLAK